MGKDTVSSDLSDKVSKAVRAIWQKTVFRPEIAIVLGTGLGNLTKSVKKEFTIAYEDIPHFPRSTVQSHAGRLVFGKLGGKRLVIMDGRFHYYEGYTLEQVTFPIRVMRKLGAKILVLCSAAGGVNLTYKKADLVLIEDHINFMGVNPLVGPNDDRLGIRFPDMSAPYSARLIDIAEKAARHHRLHVRRGVYMGVSGPCLETRAEYRMMHKMGADLIGMSTVPEVIVGVHAGFEILGIGVVTDLCDPDHLKPVNLEEIIRTAVEAGPKLDLLLESFVVKLPHVD